MAKQRNDGAHSWPRENRHKIGCRVVSGRRVSVMLCERCRRTLSSHSVIQPHGVMPAWRRRIHRGEPQRGRRAVAEGRAAQRRADTPMTHGGELGRRCLQHIDVLRLLLRHCPGFDAQRHRDDRGDGCIIFQAIRAVLLASATAANFGDLRLRKLKQPTWPSLAPRSTAVPGMWTDE
jgi:hypothetical protein